MTVDPTAATPNPSGIVQRVQDILLRPQATWPVIATENTSIGALLTGYIAPLAAIAAIAAMLGVLMIFGLAGLVGALIFAIVQVALWCVGTVIWGIIINALASSMGSEANQTRAFQLSAYSATGALVGGIGAIIPVLGTVIAFVGGIYSLVLLYMGLGPMMKTPEDKKIVYVLVLVGIAIVAGIIISTLFWGMFMGMLGLGMHSAFTIPK